MAGGGVTTVGSISGSGDAEGASISGSTITLHPVTATSGGILTTGTQQISGAKTWNDIATFADEIRANSVRFISQDASGFYSTLYSTGLTSNFSHLIVQEAADTIATRAWAKANLIGGGSAVSSVTGTANQITASPTTGAVTLSIPSVFSAPGTVTAATGFTVTTGGATITAGGLTVTAGGALITAGGLTVTAGTTTLTPLNSIGIVVNSAAGVLSTYGATDHGLQIGNATGQIASLGLGTAGQFLVSNGAGFDPSWQTGGDTSNLIVADTGATGFPILVPHNDTLFNRKISATAGVDIVMSPTGELILSADDSYFSQYFRLIGRAGGQVAAGGTGSGESMTLTSNFTTGKKYIFFRPDSLAGFDEDRNRFFVGDIIPQAPYSVRIESGSLFRTFYTRNISNSASAQNVFAFYNDNADTSTASGVHLSLTSSTGASGGNSLKNSFGINNRYNGHLFFATNNAERVRIDSLGRVGIGTTLPNALLDMTSTTGGFLKPRMNTTQQNAIASPAVGLSIYNLDSLKTCEYNGTAWVCSGTGGGGGTSYTFASGVTNTAGTVTNDLITGISGGNTIIGGTAANNDLVIEGTSHATKVTSYVNMQTTGGLVGIGQTTPVSPLHVTAISAASTAESIFRASVSDDANSYYSISNGSSANSTFSPLIYGVTGTATTQTALFFVGEASAATETGTTPLMVFDSRRTGAVASNRPLFDFRTFGTSKMLMTAAGSLGIGTTAADRIFEINLGTSNGVRYSYNDANGSAANYFETTIASTGSPTFNAVGTSPEFNFSDDIRMAANKITASDISLVGLDVDNNVDTLLGLSGGVVVKWVIPTVSNDAVPDSLDGAKFTPTLVDNPAGYNSNVASSANVTAYYHKIGNIVTVWGTITAVATAGSTNSAVAVTLPIASNLAAGDVTGGAKWNVTIGVNYTDLDGAVNTDATNDRVVIGWNSHAATADHNIFYRYTYQVK